jgi:exodeoxyribonuclease VII small subunit
MMGDQAPKMDFEEAMGRLEVIVRKLEAGDIKLDEALQLFEEGVALSRHCAALLDQAEKRIQVLVDVEGADPVVEEFDNPPPGVA